MSLTNNKFYCTSGNHGNPGANQSYTVNMETRAVLSLMKLYHYSAKLGVTHSLTKGNHGNSITMKSESSFKPGLRHHSQTSSHCDHSDEGVTQSFKHTAGIV